MTKALSIKDTEIYELVATLAAETDLSMTQAVKIAVLARLEHVRDQRRAQADAWLERLRANPLPEDAWVEPWDPPMPDFEPIEFD
jgi:hypothetical protein